MNVALLILDHLPEEPFFYKNGLPYTLDGTLYEPSWGLRNIFNLPAPFDGYFIKDQIGVKFDIIFLVGENGYHDVSRIRKNFPGAMIVGYSKEKNPIWHLPKDRIDFWKQCDKVALPYAQETINEIEKTTGLKIHRMPYPYDIDRIRSQYLKPTKTNTIMNACGSLVRGAGKCAEFSGQMANKYGFDLLDTKPDYPWKQWLELLSSCKMCINMDTRPEIGQVPIECAILGIPHVGGIADAAKILWSKSATNQTHELEKYIENNSFEEDVDNALEKCYQNYSFEAARININEF